MSDPVIPGSSYGSDYVNRLLESKSELVRDHIVEEFRQICTEAEADGPGAPEAREVVDRATDEFIRLLGEDRDTRDFNLIRSYVPIFLGAAGTDEARRALADRLEEEENDVVIKWITRVLVENFPDPPMETIQRVFQRECEGIIYGRWALVQPVAEHVERCGRPGVQMLLTAIEDRYEEVRRPAIAGLRRAAARTDLFERESGRPLDDSGPAEPRRRAQDALCRIVEGETGVQVGALERREAVEALGSLGDEDAVEVLERRATSTTEASSVRRAAVRVLGEIGHRAPSPEKGTVSPARRDVLHALARLVDGPDRPVAAAATRALVRMLGSEGKARERLLDWTLADPPEVGIRPCADALRRLDPRASARIVQQRLRVKREGDTGNGEDLGPENRAWIQRATKLLTHIGGETALEVYHNAQQELDRAERQARRMLEDTLAEAKEAACSSRKASMWIVRVGIGVVAVAVVLAFVFPENPLAAGMIGTAGLGSLVATFFTTPMDRIERAVDNLVRTQVAFVGFLHQVSVPRALLQRKFLEGKLDGDTMDDLLGHIREAMASVGDLVSPAAAGTPAEGD